MRPRALKLRCRLHWKRIGFRLTVPTPGTRSRSGRSNGRPRAEHGGALCPGPTPRAYHRRGVRGRRGLRECRRAAGAARARRQGAARRMEAELRARQGDAGEPRADRHRPRPVGRLPYGQVDLGGGRGADPGALAVDDLRHHAGEPRARSDAGRSRRCRDPRADREMGHAACRPHRARHRGEPCLSVGDPLATPVMESPTSDILFARRGAAGVVTLNRPAALNAITHEMVRALARQLDAWASDDAVTRVVVTAAGERAFSAGDDIRALYDFGRAGRQDEALTFFREEYTLNAAIKRYPKPYVALIDGIVMGGGFGVSVHGSQRVAGDRFQFAMPEVGIGFFPDVGATWVLPRMPGETGAWCALTGERMKTADSVAEIGRASR